MSSEIVEIGEDSQSFVREATHPTAAAVATSRDVYVAVGKDDVSVLQWVLNNLFSACGRIFLVHVFPPVTYIPTPAGKLSRSQLSPDQVRVYISEENNRRRNLLQKYIRLCTDAKVPVDTMLIESHATAKALVDLIPVLHITNLVIGTNKSPYPRVLPKRYSKGEYVRKNAPDYCEVSVVYNGQKVIEATETPQINKQWKIVKWGCFS